MRAPCSRRTHCCSRDVRKGTIFHGLKLVRVHVRVESGEDIKSKQICLFIVVGGRPVQMTRSSAPCVGQDGALIRVLTYITRFTYAPARSCWFAIRHRRVWLAPPESGPSRTTALHCVNLLMVTASCVGTRHGHGEHVRNSRV